jgi:hypothetical protein
MLTVTLEPRGWEGERGILTSREEPGARQGFRIGEERNEVEGLLFS